MARQPRKQTTRRPPEEREPELLVSRQDLEAKLAERVARGRAMLERQATSEQMFSELKNALYSWDEFNRTLIRRSFSTSGPADSYARSAGVFVMGGGPTPLAKRMDELHDDISKKLRRLESLREQLELYDEAGAVDSLEPVAPLSSSSGSDVFIVHGHETWIREAAARFVQEVSTSKVIILHEQPNSGRTIIEKFEDYAPRAGFAIVLLTGDDIGGLKEGNDERPRARQNVVFELGFFIGRIGRNRVAALYEEGVELPSDMSGVLYTKLDDAGAWKLDLAREMKAAGLAVDLNKAI